MHKHYCNCMYCKYKLQNKQSNYAATLTAPNNFELKNTDSSGANYYRANRELIHNANLDAVVSNSIKATNQLEEKTIQCKGFIIKSNMERILNKTVKSVISPDSIKQVSFFQNKTTIIVRVPDSSLQNFLFYTQQICSIINNRHIDGQDVSLAVKQNNSEEITKSIDVANDEKFVTTLLTSEDKKFQKLKLQDAINYCTITITLTEPESFSISRIVNTDANWSKQSNVFTKMWFNIQKGLSSLLNFFVYILQFWFLIPLGVFGYWLYKKSNKFLHKN